ncbi:hypothetical protein [Xanthomonas pisi]|nr:hypothetical protein [Xanthomonas pisi]
MSADIVGSTAFKQRSDLAAKTWFGMVSTFYSSSQTAFSEKWELALKEHRNSGSSLSLSPEAPELWKTIGDEVLFTKEITHAHEALICMRVWLDVLRSVRDGLAKSNLLELKASAWLADFPIRNRAIFLKTNIPHLPPSPGTTSKAADATNSAPISILDSGNPDWNNDQLFDDFKRGNASINQDFIGQSIDTGFRVSTQSSVRKLALSVELAHMLSMVCALIEKNKLEIPMLADDKFQFYFEGRQALKGVMGGIPYPLIWLDAEPERVIHAAEDALMQRPKPDSSLIHEFTSAMIEEFPDRFCTMLEFHGGKPLGYEAYEKKVTAAIVELEIEFKDLDRAMTADKRGGPRTEQGERQHTEDLTSLFQDPLAHVARTPPPTSSPEEVVQPGDE